MNQSAQNLTTDSVKDTSSTNQPAVNLTTSQSKESEPLAGKEEIKEALPEVEVSKEISQAGVKPITETIELPPDIKHLGVSATGTAIPVVTALPSVKLPISDQKVVQGLHRPISDALRWLAVWCLKKLRKAHLALKMLHGKVIRVIS